MVSEEIGRSPGDKAVVTKLLSSFYVSRGKYKEALEIVLARDTDGRLLMDFVPSIKNEGTYDLASTAYKIAYERSKDDKLKLSALLGQAECWEGLGRYPEAIGAYKQIAEGYPTSMLAINSLLSIAKIYRGRFHSPDSAKIYLARLLSIIGQRSDLSPSALLELAKCEVMLGDVDSSLRCLPAKIPDAKAVFTDEQAQGLLLAGRCYFWKEEIDSAVAIWEKLARLKPMSDPANDALKDILLVKETKDTTLIKGFASAWFSAEQWKLPDAISAYQRIITKSLSSVIGGRSAMGIADCWVNLSLPDSALLSLDIYLESAPSAQLKDEILYQAGQICEKELGDAVKARGYYERLLLECPESPLGPRVRVGL
jgi:tetratricopeptide (TPR) repeat protein